jgi:hypothetical protein
MKKTSVLIATITIICSSVYAQPAKSVYAELGGPGLASINFDIRFSNSEKGLGGKVGVGGFSVAGVSIVGVPMAINYLTSKDQKNYLEIGAGFTPVFTNDKTLNADGHNDNFQTSFGHLWFGYRLQPKDGGFTFRAGICPVFGNGFFIPYYAGLSFGYKF